MKRYRRSRRHRILAGVLGGLGNYLGVHPAWLRVGFLLLLILPYLSFALALGYLLLWALAPEASPEEEHPFALPLPGLTRSKTDRVLLGIAGGLAYRFRVDPLLIRVAFVLLALLYGTGVFLYLVFWILIPEEA
ncbi:PspC domain-containing protein [Marinithermus hydrothermalis]|uniref:PspC domain protein n=1 Tax=Marinithermus hydrothermalis (strain DSM 14884 / JCM 11576 / T1) TaxID=869210 RepID=F2NNG5_MARHT|nr:PspC domain-containing protein [Marinithermus hydrothermalis]AEB10775.1 PspC domain protein [Marinithermus hydrothermalis DSM 14884]